MAGGTRMWERRPEDPDFCLVRVGIGDQPLSTALTSPDLSSVDELDPVTVTAMRRFIRSPVDRSPIRRSRWLCDRFSVITVDGDAHVARALLRSLICQLAVLHGPDHIAIGRRRRCRDERRVGLAEMASAPSAFTASDEVGSARMRVPSVVRAANEVSDCGARDSEHVVMILDGGDSTASSTSTSGRHHHRRDRRAEQCRDQADLQLRVSRRNA